MTFEEWWEKNQQFMGMDCYPDDFKLAYEEGKREGLLKGQRICKEAIEAVYGEQSFNDKWEDMDT